jgi:hypothetical protein
MAFRDLDDFWLPHTMAGAAVSQPYVSGLDDERKAALREQLRATLPFAADGSLHAIDRAWAVRGHEANGLRGLLSGAARRPVLLRGVALRAGALAVLAARPLRAAAGRTAVDGSVAALVALLRLGAILFEGRFAGIAAVSPCRVEILIFVVVPLRHRLPPILVPFLARSQPSGRESARTMRTGGAPSDCLTPLPPTPHFPNSFADTRHKGR